MKETPAAGPIINGLLRAVTVLAWIAFILGEVFIFASSAAQNAFSYRDYMTGQLTVVPAKPFQWDNLIIYSFVWAMVVFVVSMVIVYVINGFRRS